MPVGRAWQAAAGTAAAVITAAFAACAGVIPAAAAGPPVRPHQHFIGLVNGQSGRSSRVVIRMACFGPTRPGQTGHPMRHQTVSVRRAAAGHVPEGYTGTGTSIGAFFGAPPPMARLASYIAFHRYTIQRMPTSLVLPCSGRGTVIFVPLPLNPHSRSFAVPVVFEGQP